MERLSVVFAGLLLVVSLAAHAVKPSEIPDPDVEYGPPGGLPMPKTILFSASPDQIAADAEEWAKRGISAFFLDQVARDWSSDIWATDKEPWTIGASDATFQKSKEAAAVCRRIGSELFLKIAFDRHFEWFNDTQWQKINHNFRQFAIFARDAGCHGIALDIEYVGDQYSFGWEGYDYKGYSREDLVLKVRDRLRTAVAGMYDEFPDMIFLTFPDCGFSLGSAIQTAWIEEAALRNAPGGVHYCTEHTYRNPNIREMFAYIWTINHFFRHTLSNRAYRYWLEQCSIAPGIWPFGFNYESVHEPGMTRDAFRQGFAASLMLGRRYNWIYSHNCYEQLVGRQLDLCRNPAEVETYLKVLTDREIVTTPKYLNLAQELREMRLRDYSGELGFEPFAACMGPDDTPALQVVPKDSMGGSASDVLWDMACRHFRGEAISFRRFFGTQTDWMVIGPFPSAEKLQGHNVAFPPEQEIDLKAEYDGVDGKARWREYKAPSDRASVDFTKVFNPTENVCAYALCYVTSPVEREAQIRAGTNDAGKIWLGGKLVLDYPEEGGAILDRDIIPIVLPSGKTPILVKVCNGVNNWGFVFRITDRTGNPIPDLRFGLVKE
ncbi:MAG TPA: hypothetical protein PKO36_12405 [Candidatus Hydrogenedentes bacterium]|nr:hypothetical protein [Candidatus Hydrogenedentota bacterium]HOV73903.1 hypothetical protein [Candidatus Hydrogenedentota bacterium]